MQNQGIVDASGEEPRASTVCANGINDGHRAAGERDSFEWWYFDFNVSATLQFICRLPVRKSITCFHLVMYPGSKIYHEAIRDGKIAKDEAIYMEEFADLRASWAKVWLLLYRAGVPLFMLRTTLLKPLFRALDSLMDAEVL